METIVSTSSPSSLSQLNERRNSGIRAMPNPSYEYSKRNNKKIRSKKQAKRHESLCYLLSLFGNDYVNFNEDEDDIFQRENILMDQESPFFKLFSDDQKLKIWLDFISKSGDKQDHLLDQYDIQMIQYESRTVDDREPLEKAHECFCRIDKNIRAIYKKEHSLICLEKYESEILPLFLCTNFSEHCLSGIDCPFERMVLHGLSQYLNIKSKSFDGENGSKHVILKCDNELFKLRMPPILLSEYVRKRFF
ncbi:unnamed protein product [Brachionus calyciflorus]|uniref:R3H-associated N-terminal domain-containing protein n=1 Tax=Brachionus calyciflorus TaxID=104777 RepID=A0A813SI08_9BILA|nr:unnamed protein product [Brachionus calyciflorus]